MKNIKFEVFGLGLLVAVVTAVSSLGAQTRASSDTGVYEPSARTSGARRTRGPARRDGQRRRSQRSAGRGKIDEVNEDSPAQRAGIKAGDIVVDYDGERVRSARQFTRLVQETPEGRSVAIGIIRDGKKQTMNATPETGRMAWDCRPGSGELGTGNPGFHFRRNCPNSDLISRSMPRRFEYRLPDEFRFPTPGSRFPFTRGRLGVSVQSITPELAEYFGAKNGGALVSSVAKESAAAKAGIRAGDVIVSINGKASLGRRRTSRRDRKHHRRGDDRRGSRQEGNDAQGDDREGRPRPTAPRAGYGQGWG